MILSVSAFSHAQVSQARPHCFHQELQRAMSPLRVVRVLRHGQQHAESPDRLIELTDTVRALLRAPTIHTCSII